MIALMLGAGRKLGFGRGNTPPTDWLTHSNYHTITI